MSEDWDTDAALLAKWRDGDKQDDRAVVGLDGCLYLADRPLPTGPVVVSKPSGGNPKPR